LSSPRACHQVVRSLLLTRPKIAESLANSGLESSFGEMCRNLPLDLLRPCLLKLFEILFDLLSSYYIMMRWHEYGLQQKQLLKSLSNSGQPLAGRAGTSYQICFCLAPCNAIHSVPPQSKHVSHGYTPSELCTSSSVASHNGVDSRQCRINVPQ
jgi:hypothetical protein